MRAGLFVSIVLGIAMPASATENGGTNRPPGGDTLRAGIMPPAGWFFLTTASTYDSQHLLDSSGNDRAGFSNVNVSVSALALRAEYTWSGFHPWGADIQTRAAIVAQIDTAIRVDRATPTGKAHLESSAKGVGDSFIAPLNLGWHAERYHQVAGALMTLTTGSYDPTVIASPGRGYSSLAPYYQFTWLPRERFDVSGSIFYLFNRTNGHTNYKSGNEFCLDYSVGYDVATNMQLGVNGFWYQQTTDDRQNGQVFGDGNRGKAVAIGPFVRLFGRGWGVGLRALHEGAVENRARGNKIALQGGIKF